MLCKNTLNEEIVRLKRLQIIVPLSIDETPIWCNNFVLVHKANGKVRLSLDPARLNKRLLRSIHIG